jgi:anti-sigma regulatory factor (Ser/Thr protein kinase)
MSRVVPLPGEVTRNRLTTRIAANFDGVRKAADSLREFLGTYALPPVASSRIELALVESLNSIVAHAGVAPSDMIDLRLTSNGAVLEIVVADPGPPLDVERMNREDATETAAEEEMEDDRRRGLALIRAIVDRVAFSRERGQNVLILTCAIADNR